MTRLAWLGLLWACGSDPVDSDPPTPENFTREAVTDGGTWSLVYTPDPDPIPQSDPFGLRLTVEGPTVPTVGFVAIMPEHNHGMNTEALVTPSETPGVFEVSSMLFHMPGHWRMTVELGENPDAESAVFDVMCCD